MLDKTKSYITEIKQILIQARAQAYKAVNSAMVQAYWLIGKRIVEEEQDGKKRANYGKEILLTLSRELTKEFGKGFDESNLRYIRQFYKSFPIRDALRHELSWTHYRLLVKITDDRARYFYMNECIRTRWSTRQLERQISTHFYERLLSSHNKKDVSEEIMKLESPAQPKDFIRSPYVLEFLDISPSPNLYEKDLETAIINHLQSFLLELGRGFSFVARQKRISFDGRDFYIDLVFYHYILKCFVLVDLKMGDLTHQDLGQMQMYVNYYSRELRQKKDNPPIGLILCADKSEAVVKYTLPENNKHIFASKYMLYLPTEKELIAEIEHQKRILRLHVEE